MGDYEEKKAEIEERKEIEFWKTIGKIITIIVVIVILLPIAVAYLK